MSGVCPSCGAHDVHHSRPRNWLERTRCRLTSRVPFRCHRCTWRGWRRDIIARPSEASLHSLHRDLTEAELDRLDPDRQTRK